MTIIKRKIIVHKLLKSKSREEIEKALRSAEDEMYSVFSDYIRILSIKFDKYPERKNKLTKRYLFVSEIFDQIREEQYKAQKDFYNYKNNL